MWHEFEGRRSYAAEDRMGFKITKQRKLEPRNEVVIFRKKRGLFKREVISEVFVRVISKDKATIVAKRPQEPVIQAGGFVIFPHQIPGHVATNTFDVIKQDIRIQDPKGKKVKGVLWTNEEGIKPELFASKLGRDFYEGDMDPEAKQMREQVAGLNRLIAEGKVAGGGMGSGI